MSDILFIPLNSNHVKIFNEIIKTMPGGYDFLCYDRICNAPHFYTESTLKELGLSYKHFSKSISRNSSDKLLKQIMDFFRMKTEIYKILDQLKPDLLVFSIDHDPIAKIFIESAKRMRIKTVLIQEALIRPHEFKTRKKYLSDYLFNILKKLGIHLRYDVYGTSGCDYILVGGDRPKSILMQRNISKDQIIIVGQPKYDSIIKTINELGKIKQKKQVFLYIASTKIISDEQNIRFLNKIVENSEKLNSQLIIKLHPRAPIDPGDVKKFIKKKESPHFSIIKEGDDTYSVLQKSAVMITVSSTVILEALMMDRECIITNYLAGEGRLDYESYDAVFSVNNENELYKTMKISLSQKKYPVKKKKLLEDELYELDGNAALRASDFILSLIPQKN
jgi:hypothetical protein